jgi:hypothetical protein
MDLPIFMEKIRVRMIRQRDGSLHMILIIILIVIIVHVWCPRSKISKRNTGNLPTRTYPPKKEQHPATMVFKTKRRPNHERHGANKVHGNSYKKQKHNPNEKREKTLPSMFHNPKFDEL